MKHNQPNNWIRKLLFAFGVALFHFGLAHVIISLSSRRVRALLYHSIDSQTNDWTEGLGVNVTPAEFAANLAYFHKYYNVVDVMDVAAQPALKRPLVITFDDGYKNILTHAAPVLQQYNMPATVYLISRATNGELVWVNLLNRALRHAPEKTRKLLRRWPELSSDHSNQAIIRTVQEHFTPTAIEALCTEIRNAFSAATLAPETDLYLNRDDIHSLTQQNIRFGFHTRDHYNMGICTHNEVISQLNTNDIADLLNSRSFAYPFGYFNACK